MRPVSIVEHSEPLLREREEQVQKYIKKELHVIIGERDGEGERKSGDGKKERGGRYPDSHTNSKEVETEAEGRQRRRKRNRGETR